MEFRDNMVKRERRRRESEVTSPALSGTTSPAHRPSSPPAPFPDLSSIDAQLGIFDGQSSSEPPMLSLDRPTTITTSPERANLSLASSSRQSETRASSPQDFSSARELISPIKTPEPTALEQENGPHRPWWKEAVCYQVWPRSFNDSGKTNKKGHGDITGIIEKLGHIKSLGVDIVWLSPTYLSPQQDYGYDISSYEKMDEDFGSMEQMEQLIAKVNELDMKLILDLVINHTSEQHAWFQESKKDKANPKADWYIWSDPKKDSEGSWICKPNGKWKEPTNWRAALIHGSCWTWCEERQQFYLHCFLEEQPDLNWENEDCRRAIYASAVEFWLKKGVAGFRIDTANRMSKDMTFKDAPVKVKGDEWQDMGKHCLNGPRMHEYLQEMRLLAMDKYDRDLILVGELPGTQHKELLKYVSYDRRELSMTFDFDMMEIGGNDHPDEVDKHEVLNPGEGHLLPMMKECLAKAQNLITETDGNAWCTVFAENHDQVRSIRRWVTDNPRYWEQACKMMCLMLTTLSGTLFVFQGQEIGMRNPPPYWGSGHFRDIDAEVWAKHMKEKYPNDPYMEQQAYNGILNVGRDTTRTPMQWDGSLHAGFTTYERGPWIDVHPGYSKINVEKQVHDEDSVLSFWKIMIMYRKRHKELFVHGKFKCWNTEHPRLFIYSKESKDGFYAVVVLNFSAERQEFDLPHELLTRKRKPLILEPSVYPKYEREPGVLKAWEARVYLI